MLTISMANQPIKFTNMHILHMFINHDANTTQSKYLQTVQPLIAFLIAF